MNIWGRLKEVSFKERHRDEVYNPALWYPAEYRADYLLSIPLAYGVSYALRKDRRYLNCVL